MVRRKAFEEVGGFDEQFFFYAEESDLFARLREAGWSRPLRARGAGGPPRRGRERLRRAGRARPAPHRRPPAVRAQAPWRRRRAPDGSRASLGSAAALGARAPPVRTARSRAAPALRRHARGRAHAVIRFSTRWDPSGSSCPEAASAAGAAARPEITRPSAAFVDFVFRPEEEYCWECYAYIQPFVDDVAPVSRDPYQPVTKPALP